MKKEILAVYAAMLISGPVAASNRCSSRDGAQYCTCESRQQCVNDETTCGCEAGPERVPLFRNYPKYSAPVPDVTFSTPQEYLGAALDAISRHDDKRAIDLIEKAQTLILDRSVPLYATHVPITDNVINELSQAKQYLLTKDWDSAIDAIGTCLQTLGKSDDK